MAGGVVYSLGAIVYALKWPNPLPKRFGFHEIGTCSSWPRARSSILLFEATVEASEDVHGRHPPSQEACPHGPPRLRSEPFTGLLVDVVFRTEGVLR